MEDNDSNVPSTESRPEDSTAAGGEMELVTPPPQPEDTCSRAVYDELYARYVRLQADFDNFRKRTERDRSEYRALATERLVTDLLPVLDHLELAVRHARESGAPEAFIEGVALVLRQFQGVLEKDGLQPVEAAGTPFDPRFHEAVVQVESAEVEENTVVEEFQRGYRLGNKILRPAKVSVSRGAPPAGTDDEPGHRH